MANTSRIKAGSAYSLNDFKKAGEHIASEYAASRTQYQKLMQDWTIRAIEHLDKHGNFLILKPLFNAAQSFGKAGRGGTNAEGRRWRSYIVAFTRLVYNPKNLKGTQLRDAEYEALWSTDKRKTTRLDEAKAVAWHDFSIPRVSDGKATNLTSEVARIMKRIQALLDNHALVTSNGMATAATVRTEFKAMMENLTNPKDQKATPVADIAKEREARKAPAKVTATKAAPAAKRKAA